MRKVALITVAMVWIALTMKPARAQFSYSGPVYGATFLGFPLGVRNIGMGATGTADATNLATGYFNPASVAFADATTFVSSYEDVLKDFGLSEFLVTTPVPIRQDSIRGDWQFSGSLGYTRFWLPTQVERTIFLPDGTGTTYDQDDWMISGGSAVSWTHGIACLAIGGTAKLIQPAPNGPTMWSFDVGVLAAFPIELSGGRVRPRLGYAALNLDAGNEYDGREVLVRNESRGGLGFDYQTPAVVVFGQQVAAAQFSFDYDFIDRAGRSSDDDAFGLELSAIDMMHFRFGVIDESSRILGIGLGWDYGHMLFRLDYAHANNQQLSSYYDRDTFGALVGVRW